MTRTASTTTARVSRGQAKVAEEPEEVIVPFEDDEDTDGGVDADGRAWARFEFNGKRARMYEPTGGQRFVLLQTVGITDESADEQEKIELALGFATMIRALFVHASERQYVTGALARGTAEIEDYFGLARDMAEHWSIESEPPAANRDERRARERRPVAKAAARGRRPATR